MEFWPSYLIVISISFIAMVSPGPDFLIVIRNALGLGRRHGIFTSIGIALGLMVHVAYSVFGIALIISQSILVFNIIKYLGAAYLLWLGYKSLKSKGWKMEAQAAQNKEKSVWKAFKEGFITNALNPKATMFFLALFTQVVAPETPFLWQLSYGITIIVMAGLWFSFVTLVLTNERIRKALSRASIWIDRITGLMLIGLGFKIITEKTA